MKKVGIFNHLLTRLLYLYLTSKTDKIRLYNIKLVELDYTNNYMD